MKLAGSVTAGRALVRRRSHQGGIFTVVRSNGRADVVLLIAIAVGADIDLRDKLDPIEIGKAADPAGGLCFTRANNTRAQTPAMLKGLLFTDTGVAMTPTHTRKGERLYRYYVSMDAVHNRIGENDALPRRLNAGMVEGVVIQELRRMLTTPVIVARAIDAARELEPDINENEVIAALSGFGELWQTLFPAEQARIARLLIQRVTVNDNSIDVDLCTKGLGPIIHNMLAPRKAA